MREVVIRRCKNSPFTANVRPIQYLRNIRGGSAMRAARAAIPLTIATQAGAECDNLCDRD